MSKSQDRSWKPVENPQLAEAMRQLRRSGAAGIHEDRRTRRQRDRSTNRRRAIEEAGE